MGGPDGRPGLAAIMAASPVPKPRPERTRWRWPSPPDRTPAPGPTARLHRAEPEAGAQHATWLELFYDLVFVVIVGELAHTLADEVS